MAINRHWQGMAKKLRANECWLIAISYKLKEGLPLPCPFVKLYMLGAVAQLGERLTGSQKVEGSNPSSSTKEDFSTPKL